MLGETYAGLWIAKDGHCLVVAVTNQPEHAAATLRDIVPEAPLRVVWRRQPLAMLEALADTLIEMGDRLGAPWAYVGVCEPSNVVQAALTDSIILRAARSRSTSTMTRCDGSRTPSSRPRLLPESTTGSAPGAAGAAASELLALPARK